MCPRALSVALEASTHSMEGVESAGGSPYAFSVTHGVPEKGARAGQLTLGSKTLATPALFVHSSHGSPQNLTPDLVAKLSELKAVHINAKNLYVPRTVGLALQLCY